MRLDPRATASTNLCNIETRNFVFMGKGGRHRIQPSDEEGARDRQEGRRVVLNKLMYTATTTTTLPAVQRGWSRGEAGLILLKEPIVGRANTM